jgi:type II secretory pathway pseudopilin PulG
MVTSTVGLPSRKQNGFSYVMLLAILAIVGIFMGAAAEVSSRVAQSAREKELIFRGVAYLKAITSYYQATNGYRHYPRSLEELIQDPRFPNRRHLRKLYDDPISKQHQWRLIRAVDGGISGVCSSSDNEPLKKSGFPRGLVSFEGAERYSDWCFDASLIHLASLNG